MLVLRTSLRYMQVSPLRRDAPSVEMTNSRGSSGEAGPPPTAKDDKGRG
jgi:hypothetical protein